MEEVELNKNNKKRPKQGMSDNQKGWLVFGGLAVIAFFGGFYLLFLSSEQEQLASELTQEIKGLEGEGYKQKVGKFIQQEMNELAPKDDKSQQELSEMISSLNHHATFSPLKEFSDNEFGGVEIAEVKVTSSISEDNYRDVIIKKKPAEPNKYYFSYNGESKQLLDDPRLIEKPRASFITKFVSAQGALELTDSNKLQMLENKLDEVSFTDGSGSITYLVMKDVYAKISKNFTVDSTDFSVQFSSEKVDLGEAIKFMLGDVKPMKVKFDLQYSGDSLAKLEKISEGKLDDFAKYIRQDTKQNLAEISAEEKYSGRMQLKDFQLMSGEMGFVSNADLEFKGFPYMPVPVGDLKFTVQNYQQIITYARNFFPVAETEVEKMLKDMSAYFVNDGTNLIFEANFDGTRNVKLGNGRVMDLLRKPDGDWTSGDNSVPKPDYEPAFETPVKSEAKPITVPKVEQKKLGF